MKRNKGSAINILVIFTAILCIGAVLYLQEQHAGSFVIPFFSGTSQSAPIDTVAGSSDTASSVPIVDVGSDIILEYPKSSVTLTGSATEPGSGWFGYEWKKLSGPTAKIVSPTSNTTTITGLQKGLYVFRLVVTDVTGQKSADDLFVTVGAPSTTTAVATKTGTTTKTTTTGTTKTPSTSQTGYTKTQVATHNSQTNCWLIISSKIYNVTAFIAEHPGGKSAIVSRCGTDVTTAFNGGVYNHSAYARGLLPTYYIGTIGSSTTPSTPVTTPATPAQNIPPFADAGSNKTIDLPTSSVTLTGSGTDSDGTIASYAWTKVSGGAATISSPSAVSTSVTGLVQGSYSFKLTVTDNSGATSTDTVTVTVNAVVPPPPASGYTTDQVATHSSTTNCWIIITNKIYNVSSFLGSHPGGVSSITPYCGRDATVAFHTHGQSGGSDHSSYAYSLLPTYYVGDLSTNTPPPNTPPSVDAGASQTITLPTSSVTLTGSGTDSDGSIASYAWTKVSGGAATITSPSAASTSVTGLVQGSYSFKLTVTDNSGATSSSTVAVVVNIAAANVPPVADAGSNQSTQLPLDSVTLTGSGTDSDGTIASYAWTKVSGGAATITSPSAASTSVTGLVAGSYTFQLSVTDNSGASDTATVVVTVNAAAVNTPPTANAGANQNITVPTSLVTLSGSGTDSDGTIASYFWTTVSGGAAAIESPSASTTNVTGLVAGSYTFQLTVTDNQGATGTDSMIVTVNGSVPTNLPPTANAGTPQTITLPTSSVTLTGSGTDSDGSIASYAWTKVSGGAATITSPSAASTSVTGLVAGSYTFQLSVTDNSGASDTATVVVTVNAAAVNTPPTANAGTPQTITLPTSSVTLTGSGTDSDGSIASYAWTKVSGGAATITSPSAASTSVTGLVQGSYSFKLTVTDNSGATANATVAVTVNAAAATTYTTAQVATHNVSTNCWIIISSKIYNVTSFISAHPGGKSAISTRCGTDVTTAFNGGVWNHSSYARGLLPTYYVADVGL
jgi:cytochrome b involved in lipid metabolism